MPSLPKLLSWRLSLAIKATIIFVAVAVATIVLVSWLAREFFFESQSVRWRYHAVDLANFVSTEIINQPTIENINQLVTETGLDIRYSGPNLNYSTGDMPDPKVIPNYFDQDRHIPQWARSLPATMKVGWIKGRLYLWHTLAEHRIVYRYSRQSRAWTAGLPIVILPLAGLLLFFLIAIWLLHRLLSPLRTVTTNMAKVGEDGAEITCPTSNYPDEISSLIGSFNNMSQRINQLIKSKELLLRDVSHEIRSPLARLRLRFESVEDAKLRSQLVEEVEQIDQLTGELLSQSQLEAGSCRLHLETISVAKLLDKLHDQLPEVHRDYLTVNLPEPELKIRVDRNLVLRALTNLVDNSLKYSELQAGSICLTAQQQDANVQIMVADVGQHLADEVVVKLTDSFYQLEDSRTKSSGFGLGLAIASAIIKVHDSKLLISSPPSGGLISKFEFPLVTD